MPKGVLPSLEVKTPSVASRQLPRRGSIRRPARSGGRPPDGDTVALMINQAKIAMKPRFLRCNMPRNRPEGATDCPPPILKADAGVILASQA